MTNVIFIFLWRILVLTAGVLLAYLTAFKLFPYLDQRAPLIFALLVTYCLLAYIGIPALFRLLRLVIKPNHVPTHVNTGDGWPSDPVNIAMIVMNRRQFVRSMEYAGWYVADEATLRNVIREGYAILFDKPYPAAPCSSLYMFGRTQDVAFQIPSGPNGSPRHRHHVRFWRIDSTANDNDQTTHGYWLRSFRKLIGLDKEIWVGAATYDKHPIAFRWRSGQVTHQIDSDTNAERDFIIETLNNVKLVKRVTEVKSGEPYKFRAQTFGVTIISDGFVKLCELKRPLIRSLSKPARESKIASKKK